MTFQHLINYMQQDHVHSNEKLWAADDLILQKLSSHFNIRSNGGRRCQALYSLMFSKTLKTERLLIQ